MNKSQQKISAWQKSIGKTLKGLGAILGGIAAGKIAKDFVTTAMRTEVLDVAMRSVAKSSGYAIQALQEHRKAVMEMGIAEQEATQILTRFMQAQLDTAYAAKVARVAQDAAVIANMNSSEAAEQMTEAIAKLRPELLSAFGFTRNLNDIYSDYAKTVGKTVKQLSETEKKQAMLNYILKEGEKIAGTYEASMGVVGKQISSLPRYYDTLKNAIAKPLALPAVGVAVEAITNSLKNAISWAEANQGALQRWGQSIANIVRAVVKGFNLVTGAIVENWQALKFVATTLITYTVITKGAAAATTAWRIATLTLKGELMTKIPLLTAVSTAIGTYRLQMALAPVATNIFTASLLKLRAALYAVQAAFGPIGWVILAISAAISGGTALWSKYAQSLQKAAQASPANLAKGFRDLEKSTQKSADATEDQADALDKAGKAANKNLQSFDEIHQLQKDMAGGGGAGEDMLDEFDLGGAAAGVPGLNLDDMFAELEGIKPTLSGFWEWIKTKSKEAWGNLCDWMKAKWEGFVEWFKGTDLWERLSRVWDRVKENWKDLKNWAASIPDWIKNKWEGLKTWAGKLWDGVKAGWNAFADWVKGWALWGRLENAWERVKQNWAVFKDWAKGLWDDVKDKWGDFTDWVGDKWSKFKDKAGQIWDGVKTNVQSSWEALKKDAPAAWENIKNTITAKTDNARDALKKTWDEIVKTIDGAWVNIKNSANTTWEGIKASLSQIWNGIQTNAGNVFTTVKNTITNTWNSLKSTAQTVWNNIKNAIINPIESAKQTVLNIIDRIKNAFANMKITIPKPKLPHISVSMKSKSIGGISIPYPDFDIDWYAQGGIFNTPSVIGVGEAGAEAVLPLDRNTGWMDTLAAKIAAAIPGGQAGGDIYVYVGNEQVDAYVYRSQDRRNVKSNGR